MNNFVVCTSKNKRKFLESRVQKNYNKNIIIQKLQCRFVEKVIPRTHKTGQMLSKRFQHKVEYLYVRVAIFWNFNLINHLKPFLLADWLVNEKKKFSLSFKKRKNAGKIRQLKYFYFCIMDFDHLYRKIFIRS